MKLKPFVVSMLAVSGLVSCQFRGKVWKNIGQEVDVAAPTLVSHTPSSLTGLPINAKPVFTFNETLDSGTIAGSITVTGGVTGSSSLNADGQSITFTPSANFLHNTEYTFTIDAITDLSGNELEAPIQLVFTTTGDSTPPTFVNHIPLATQGVSKSITFTFTFNEPLDPASVSAATLTVSPVLTGTRSLSADGRTITFDPDTDLADNTAYTFTFNGIADTAGNTMAAFTLNFSTIADTTAPTLVSHAPTSTSNLGTNLNVSFTFSEAIDLASVVFDNTFTVNNGATGTLSFSADGRTITFDVAGYYTRDTDYTFTFAGIKDIAGNALTGTSSITFTTIATLPAIASSTPGDGTDNNFMTDTLTVSFSEEMSAAGASISITGPSGATRNISSVTLNPDNKGFTVTFIALPYSPGIAPGVSITLNGFKALDGTPLSGTSIVWNMEKSWEQLANVDDIYNAGSVPAFALASSSTAVYLAHISAANETIRVRQYSEGFSVTPTDWPAAFSIPGIAKNQGMAAYAVTRGGKDYVIVAYTQSTKLEVGILVSDGSTVTINKPLEAVHDAPPTPGTVRFFEDSTGNVYLSYMIGTDLIITKCTDPTVAQPKFNFAFSIGPIPGSILPAPALNPADGYFMATYYDGSATYLTMSDPILPSWDSATAFVANTVSLDAIWSKHLGTPMLFANNGSIPYDLYWAKQVSGTTETYKWQSSDTGFDATIFKAFAHSNGDYLLHWLPSQLVISRFDGTNWVDYKVSETVPQSDAFDVANPSTLSLIDIAESPFGPDDTGMFVVYQNSGEEQVVVKRHRR